MDQQEWKKVNDIVDTALEIEGKERISYINEQCGDNEELRYQVTELLKSIEESDTQDFLEGTQAFPAHLAADLSDDKEQPPASSMVGETIDQYQIKKVIGHGGMGSVFLADRADDAYQGKVALKIMRQGMDTPSNIARFERERNILAMLDHPNIARLLDGGLSNHGLPYLVMEYVDGISLFKYCDKNNLSVEQRLNLFKKVCRGVRHAHKNAVIHRDLKPSNILITQDGDVKVLDFGISKLLKSGDFDSTQLQTQTGARMLTYGYAAPEQIEGESVTTSTDAYSLGILLYELLCGVHPFDLDDKGLTEVENIIRQQSPTPPSTKFDQLPKEQQKQLTDRRNTTPKTLTKILNGDIGAITMKALRKEPEKRYRSADNILEDLKRREQSLPVIARKDTVRYKVGKFVRRHKNGIAITAGVLLFTIALSTFYAWKITEERDKAQMEAQKAQQVSSFLTDMFRASDPTFNPKDTVTAATFLERGSERIGQLENQPEIQASLLSIIGQAHSNLGRFNKAKPLIKKSLSLRKNTYGATSFEYAEGISEWGILQRQLGNFSKAESLHRKALKIKKSTVGIHNIETASTLSDLGLVLDQKGKYKEADSLYREALTLEKQILDSEDPQLAELFNNRAGVLSKMGQTEKAEKFFRKALSIWRDNYGEVHPKTSTGYNDLALVLQKQGKIAKADSLFQKNISIDKKLYGDSHPYIAQSYNNMGLLYGQNGQLEKAKPYLENALALRRKILEKNHPRLAESLNNLARLYIEMGNNEEARSLAEEALKIDKENFGEKHPYVAGDLSNLALIEKKTGSYILAEQYLRESLSIFEKALPAGHPKKSGVMLELGAVLTLNNQAIEAIPLVRKSLEIRKETYKEGSWRIAYAQIILGNAFTQTKDYAKSEKFLKQGYQTLKKERGTTSQETKKAREYLFQLYEAWDKPEMAKKYKK
ncbi:serine/threonine protein kinase with TPR repeats [Fodinibius salinus]|uniref:Serine/threonine protein kinase with TPR repeats n=1 Tax=Fodinibius salinus TaxID=860790 RepID=A0A5D3YG74_9BACT|nr:tetratricopeptide repeat protein [Fodinibius salinus]TYP92683.1 serine/threonine protein kinase with TPR repeats [Fodinibius salinus]